MNDGIHAFHQAIHHLRICQISQAVGHIRSFHLIVRLHGSASRHDKDTFHLGEVLHRSGPQKPGRPGHQNAPGIHHSLAIFMNVELTIIVTPCKSVQKHPIPTRGPSPSPHRHRPNPLNTNQVSAENKCQAGTRHPDPILLQWLHTVGQSRHRHIHQPWRVAVIPNHQPFVRAPDTAFIHCVVPKARGILKKVPSLH